MLTLFRNLWRTTLAFSVLTGLPGLPNNFIRLTFDGTVLTNGLPGLPEHINWVNLWHCSGLPGLPGLTYVELTGLTFDGFDGLPGLPKLTTRKITLKNPPLDIPGANFWEKSGNNKTPPRSGGNFFGNNKTPPRSGGKFSNNKTPPRSGGEILSFFKAKTVKICNKIMDVWITTNPRRRRGKFLKTTKTRREAAIFFWKQQDPGKKIRPKFP